MSSVIEQLLKGINVYSEFIKPFYEPLFKKFPIYVQFVPTQQLYFQSISTPILSIAFILTTLSHLFSLVDFNQAETHLEVKIMEGSPESLKLTE